MTTGFATIPGASQWRIANATLAATLVDAADLPRAGDGLVRADIDIAGNRIARIAPPSPRRNAATLDMDGGMVWPAFVDMHTHLDKGHIWPRHPNPDGTFMGALNTVAADRTANWSAHDVARRMDFALRCAYAHGTALIRTHIDSLPPQHAISWPVVAEMRERWAGRVDVQAVCLVPMDLLREDSVFGDVAATVAQHGGVLGCVTYMTPDLNQLLDRLFRVASDRGLDLDLHTDESQDPTERSLAHVAEAAIRNRFEGQIACGHCCSLARQDENEARRTIARVAEAGIAVVSLPMCNMYLQDRRSDATPRARGITLLHELRSAGVPVALASDNTRDPFYAYGDLDMAEVFREGVRIAHLDHPFAEWPASIARTPAALLRRPDRGVLSQGGPADLVLFRARRWSELLARPQADRTVVRDGRAIDRTLPDYRELDDLMHPSEALP